MSNPFQGITAMAFFMALAVLVPGLIVGALFPGATLALVIIAALVMLVGLGKQDRMDKAQEGGLKTGLLTGMGAIAFGLGVILTGWIF